jgi:signal transduction histidine kinase/DNA-binding NarL/FixJ family response regulator/HPt (histidine-containing phosphotransfer) domain-containing protein
MRFGFILHPYSLLMILAAIVSLLLAAKAWYGTRKEVARSFALIETAVFVWSVFAVIRFQVASPVDQVEAMQLEYLGIALIPGAVYLFARAVARRPLSLIRSALPLLPGIFFFIIAETNELHHLFWTDELFGSTPATPRIAWGFWVFAACSYAQICVGLFILLRAAARAKGLVARWLRIHCAILALPFVANVIFVAFFFSFSPFDPTPIVFAISGFSLTFSFGQFNFLDILPYAKKVLVDSLDTPLIVVDAEGLVVAAKDMPGAQLIGSREIVGLDFSSIFPELEGLDVDGDSKVLSRSGTDYLVSCHVVKRGSGRWHGWIYAFNDISDLAKAKREVEEARARADAANAAKSAFIATVSHELRNPLNAIIGLVDLNLRASPPAAIRYDLEVILSSGNIILGLVNDLLDLSKIEAGKMELEHIDFDLHDTALSVLRAFRPIAEKKGLFLDIVMAKETPRYVKGDPLRYGQVLMNLVSNAVKFTEHGAVTVDLALADGDPTEGVARGDGDPRTLRVLTTVHDSGMGIASDKLPLLFREFSQADPSVSRRFGGTGLGLSISKHLVGLFGGDMQVASKEGKGSVFSFTARFEAGGEAAAKTAPAGKAAAAGARSLRLLVVDDEPINTAVARRYIQRYGHECAVAGTGAEALELVAARDFDLVLLDLGLPDMDGFEACARIRAETASRPGGEPSIAAMTARAESGLRADCASAGMIDCLTKPIDPAALERLLSRVAAKAHELGPHAASTVPESRVHAEGSACPPEPTEPGTPLIDVPALLERLDRDDAFMRELLGIFVEEAPGRRAAFAEAAAGRNFEALQKLSHGLKGSSLSLCADPLGTSAGALEAACIAIRQALPAPAALPSLEARLGNLGTLLEATVAAAAAILERPASRT